MSRRQWLSGQVGFWNLLVLTGIAWALPGASRDYPTVVYQERVDPSTFVKDPNIIKNVTNIRVSRIRPTPRDGEIHVRYGVKLERDLRCREADFNNGKWTIVRTDLPGRFLCGDRRSSKLVYAIPTISTEQGRFFNVSLDFLRIDTAPNFTPPKQISDPPLQVQLLSGIIHLSGLFVDTHAGSITLAVDMDKGNDDKGHRIKIYLEVTEENSAGAELPLSVLLEQKHSGSFDQETIFRHRLSAITCISEHLSLSPVSLHHVTFEESPDRRTLNVTFDTADRPIPNPCLYVDSINHDGSNDESRDPIHECTDFIVRNINIHGTLICDSADAFKDLPNIIPELVGLYDEEENEEDATPVTNQPPDFVQVEGEENHVELTDPKRDGLTTATEATPKSITTTARVTELTEQTAERGEGTVPPETEKPTTTTNTLLPVTTRRRPQNNNAAVNEHSSGTTSFGHETNDNRGNPESRAAKGTNRSPNKTRFNATPDKTTIKESGDPIGEYRAGETDLREPFLRTTELWGIIALAIVPLVLTATVLICWVTKCRRKRRYGPVQTTCPNGLSNSTVHSDRLLDFNDPAARRNYFTEIS